MKTLLWIFTFCRLSLDLGWAQPGWSPAELMLVKANPPATTGGSVTTDTIEQGSRPGGWLSHDIAITVANHPNRALIIFVWYVETGTNYVSSITSTAGGSFSKFNGATGNNDGKGELWRCLNPATGSQTITVTFTAELSGPQIGLAYSLYNVDQTTPLSGFVGTTSGDNVITVSTGGLGISFHGDSTADRNITGCTGTEDFSDFFFAGCASASCTAATSTFTWSAFGLNSLAMGVAVEP